MACTSLSLLSSDPDVKKICEDYTTPVVFRSRLGTKCVGFANKYQSGKTYQILKEDIERTFGKSALRIVIAGQLKIDLTDSTNLEKPISSAHLNELLVKDPMVVLCD